MLAVFFSQWMLFQLLVHPDWLESLSSWKTYSEDLISVLLIAPMDMGLIVYFRFLFGFFMRNFERQADLFAMETIGSPRPLIRSLEKIGLASGQSRDLPSWHHFSIAQRVEFLEKAARHPELIRNHQKKVYSSVILFFFLLGGVGFYGVKERIWFSPDFSGDPRVVESLLTRELQLRPEDPRILMGLAMIYQEGKRTLLAQKAYEKILEKDPNNYLALNNLAWLLATSKNPDFFDPKRALVLAQRAVEIKIEPMFLDTLAEAYFVNGRPELALKITRQILAGNPANRSYYQQQEEKFNKALKDKG